MGPHSSTQLQKWLVVAMVWLSSLLGQAELWKPDWDTCVMSILQPACIQHTIFSSRLHAIIISCAPAISSATVLKLPLNEAVDLGSLGQSRKLKLEHNCR